MGGHSDHGHGEPKTSISPEEIRKILTRAKVQVPSEAPKFIASSSSGVLQTQIKGRFANERARLGPSFAEADRQWRIKFLQSQALHPSEPFDVPELNRVNYNPIRRFYRWPMDQFEKFLLKHMAKHNASCIRKLVGGTITGYLVLLTLWYQMNYNVPNWEYLKGIKYFYTRESVFPGDVRWPMPNTRTESWQHYDRGFHDRKVFLNPEK